VEASGGKWEEGRNNAAGHGGGIGAGKGAREEEQVDGDGSWRATGRGGIGRG